MLNKKQLNRIADFFIHNRNLTIENKKLRKLLNQSDGNKRFKSLLEDNKTLHYQCNILKIQNIKLREHVTELIERNQELQRKIKS